MDRLSLAGEYDAWSGYIAGIERTLSLLLTMVTRHGSIDEARDWQPYSGRKLPSGMMVYPIWLTAWTHAHAT